MPQSSAAKRSVGKRLSSKVGPLPVWAWAAVILGAYLAYSKLHGDSPSTATPAASTDTGATGNIAPGNGGSDTGAVGSGGSGSPAANLDQGSLSALTGLQGSIDALTAILQLTPAYGGDQGAAPAGLEAPMPSSTVASSYGQNDAQLPGWVGSGGGSAGGYSLAGLNVVAGGGAGSPSGSRTPVKQPAPVAPKPVSRPAPTRYYTYAPGKAPAGRSGDAAPSSAGLHFAAGKGYYY